MGSQRFSLLRSIGAAVVLAVGLGLVWTAGPVSAAPLEKLDVSLRYVPEDASFYGAFLRGREQVEIVRKSRAWEALRTLPAVREMEHSAKAGLEMSGNADKVNTFLGNPEVQAAIKLLKEMFSEDFFIYADASVPDALAFMNKINAVNQASQFEDLAALAKGDRSTPRERPAKMAREMLKLINDQPGDLKIPAMVFGFRVKDKKPAQEEITKLEGIMNIMCFASPKMAGRVKRQKAGDDEFVTLSLDGAMIPWEEIKAEDIEGAKIAKADFDKAVAKFKKMTLVFSIGLRKDYLLFGIGPSTECVAKFGAGKSLAAHKDLKVLEQYADRRLTGISYVSEKMMLAAQNSEAQFAAIVKGVHGILEASPLEEDRKKRIGSDVDELAALVKSLNVPVGVNVGVRFLTDRGVEGYAYQFPGPKGLPGKPKALKLTAHAGGSPAFAAFGQLTVSVKEYDALVKWINRGIGYFKEFAVPQMGDGKRKDFEKIVTVYGPALKRLDAINREQLIPAVGDAGEIALLIDTKATERRFHTSLPELPKPMPVIEPALVFHVADGEKFAGALDAYRVLLNDVVAEVHKLEPAEVPEFAIPSAEESTVDSGKVYRIAPPKEIGVPEQFALTVGVSPNVVAIATTSKHAERLLKPTPLTVGGNPVDAAKLRYGVVVLDWAGMVDAASPWIEFAVEQNVPYDKSSGGASPVEEVRVVLSVLKTMRSTFVESYSADGAAVLHASTEFRDLDSVPKLKSGDRAKAAVKLEKAVVEAKAKAKTNAKAKAKAKPQPK